MMKVGMMKPHRSARRDSSLIVATVALLLALPFARSSSAQDLVIEGSKIHIGNGKVIENGVIVIAAGKVKSVSKGSAQSSPDALKGAVITPGLIDAHASSSWAMNPQSVVEQASEVVPEYQIADGLNLYSRGLRDLAESGVTTVFLSPGFDSVIGSQGAVIKTRTQDERGELIQSDGAIMATIGAEPSGSNSAPRGGTASLYSRRPTTRMGTAWVFRKAFYDAKYFAETGEGLDEEFSDLTLSFLGDVLSGKKKLRVRAQNRTEIDVAYTLAAEFGLSFTLIDPGESHFVFDMIAGSKSSVIYGPLDVPASSSQRGGGFRGGRGGPPGPEQALANPAHLRALGLKVALSAYDQGGETGLRHQAMLAHRFGMSEEDAVAAVSGVPAEIMGLQKRIGTLAVGLDGDAVVWSGSPLDPTSKPLYVIVNGSVVASGQ